MTRHVLLLVLACTTLAGTLSACRRGSTEPTPVCTLSIAPPSHTAPAEGGTRTVAVTASDSSCAWSASAAVPWVTITAGASGTGSATLVYTVAANTAADGRTGSIAIGDLTHAISQAGQQQPPPPTDCTYTLSPEAVQVEFIGGTGTVQVAAPDGCHWTARPDESWFRIEGSNTGSGNGSFRYRVDEYNGAATRTGTIDVEDEVFTIEQTGAPTTSCTYTVTAVELSPCMPAGTVSTRIETAPGCTWTASSTADWIVAGPTSGSGSADITLEHTANYRAPRQGIVELRWPTPSLGQNVRVSQAGCLYSTPTPTVNVAAAGGATSFDVLQQAQPNSCGGPLQDRCIWTAGSTVPWITVTTAMPRQGDQRVQLMIAANPTATERTGVVNVEQMAVQIVQAGTTP